MTACVKRDPPQPPADFSLSFKVNGGNNGGFEYRGLNLLPLISFSFTEPVDRQILESGARLVNASGNRVPLIIKDYASDSRSATFTPAQPLSELSSFEFTLENIKSSTGGRLINPVVITLKTAIDSSDKFPRISDSDLLTLVQQQTFKYFWDFGHPVSGLARERNTSGELVTTGGSGFGIMAIIVGAHRNFISRQQALARLQTIVDFLRTKADRFHGAFPHWLNGTTGKVIPFSSRDNGADLVETSFLIQGLLAARQYFSGSDAAETKLRNDINDIWHGVEWNWFRKGSENVLYWHWSPTNGWEINLPIRGWNESLITYVLAASSPTHPVPKAVYDEGWARSGAMRNGNSYYGYTLPLGPNLGGPLFLEHYSFLGINPNNLTDVYANYQVQTQNHTRINLEYVKTNPKGYYGYSAESWGLTASDVPNGYAASSPTNDLGVIAPTAALASMPYTPDESMRALRFFYYKLGDKLWGPYGFYDAYSLHLPWFASSYLAIDQGPIIVMIENYRSGLLWNLFMSSPEIKTGMRNLGFQSPNL